MTEEEIRANRLKAVEVLRTTDERQGFGSLYDPHSDCYCAAGVIARTLGHDPKDHRYPDGGDMGESYSFLEDALGLGDDGVSVIYRLNDTSRMRFKTIGDRLARRWGIE